MTEREMKHKLSPMQEQDSELASTFKKLIALLQDESETHRSNSGTQFTLLTNFWPKTIGGDLFCLNPFANFITSV